MVPAESKQDFTLYLIAVLLFTLAAGLGYGRIDYNDGLFAEWDLHSYRRMAEAAPGLATEVVSPFAYRVLGPYIVGLLPVQDTWGFYAVALTSSLALSSGLYAFLVFMGIRPGIAALSTLLFVLNKYTFGFTVWDYFQVSDALSLCLIVVAFLALKAGRWSVFTVALAVGVLTRESVLVMAPVALVYMAERGISRPQLHKWLLAVLPALLCYAALRLIVQPVGGPSGPFEQFLTHGVSKLNSLEVWLRLFVNTFLPLSLLPLIFLDYTIKFFKENRYMLVYGSLIVGSTFLGGNVERLLSPASIVFYFLIARILQDSVRPGWFVTFILIGCGWLASLHHLYGLVPLPSREMTLYLSGGAGAVVTLLVVLLRLKASLDLRLGRTWQTNAQAHRG